MMEELQEYAKCFRQSLNNPLINTPWTLFNKCLTRDSIFTMTSEGLKYGSEKINARFVVLDKLYENMLARDILNRQLYMLQHKGVSKLFIINTELQIKDLTAKIKEQLPKKLKTKLSQHVSKKFTFDDIRKMRPNCYSAKAAKTGKLLTSNLDVLNKSGLIQLSKILEGCKTLNNGVNNVGTLVTYGAVAYDTYEAMKTSGAKTAAKTFLTAVGTIYLTSQAVSACGGISTLGGLVIGSLRGEAVGATLLICSPIIGWAIVVITGAVAVGFVAYKTKGALEKAWDYTEEAASQTVSVLEKGATKMYDFGFQATQYTHKVIEEMWTQQPQWILDFYNGNTSE